VRQLSSLVRDSVSRPAEAGLAAPAGTFPEQIVALFGAQGRFAPLTTFLALAAQQGGVLVTGVIAFVLLGAHEYGRTASALAFVNIFIALGSVSSSVVTYRLALLRAREPALLYLILRFVRRAVQCSALVVAGVVVGALWLAPGPDYLKSAVTTEMAAAITFLVISVLISYQQGYVLARGDTLPLFVTNIAILAAMIPLAWVLISRWGYTGYFVALALPLAIRGVILYLREPSEPPSAAELPHFDWREVLFTFMLPATAAGFTTMPSYWLSTEFLYRIPGGASAFGLIALGISIKQAPMLFATSIISSSGRSVFQAFGEERNEMVALHRRLFLRAIAPLVGTALLVAGAAAIFLLAAEPAGGVRDGALVVAGLSAILALEILYAFVYMPINMSGVMWRSLFFIAIPKDVAFVIASMVAVPFLGWPGFLVSMMVWNGLAILFTIIICRWDARTAPFYIFKARGRQGR
jgi:hypothetical protein